MDGGWGGTIKRGRGRGKDKLKHVASDAKGQ